MEYNFDYELQELAEGDFYATKGFIGDYGTDFQKAKSAIGLSHLREFDVTPYKTMPFD